MLAGLLWPLYLHELSCPPTLDESTATVQYPPSPKKTTSGDPQRVTLPTKSSKIFMMFLVIPWPQNPVL